MSLSTSKTDLHIHTSASDGDIDPVAVLGEVTSAGISTFSFTDHECIDGMDQVSELASRILLNLIPGVELSTYFREREIHLLGYCFDPESISFRSWIKELQAKRNKIMIETVAKLRKYDFNLNCNPFYELANTGHSIGKNHIIKALFSEGYLPDKEAAIEILQRYISQDGLAYVGFDFNPLEEAARFIIESGGLPVLAHPGLIRDDRIVVELLDAVPIGLEVYYYYFGSKREQLIAHYEHIAFERGIIATGGSDFHGHYSPDVKLGKVSVPSKTVELLCQRKIR